MSLLGRFLFTTLPREWVVASQYWKHRLAHRDSPRQSVPGPSFLGAKCKLLKKRHEVEECTQFLRRNGFVSHTDACKDWDLAHIVPAIGDGNVLDMGSSDSCVLKNLSLKRVRGEKYGIDLRAPFVAVSDAKYLVGDLMNTGLPAEHFSNITCLSVLEHEVDFSRFAREAARLLAPGGHLFVTFDYWDPKVIPPIKLFGLDWQPLDAEMLRQFIATCARFGLHLMEDFDFELGDPVIRVGYFSPHPDVSYTFGMAVFQKA
jgi:SAM-dependent methyltransferase